MVVVMPTLTRTEFFNAVHAMRFYASDDWNAKVEFKMNNNCIGSVLNGTVNPSFTVLHNDMDGELADSIKIWRGISNDVNPATIVSITKSNNTSSYTDNNMVNGNEYYYFAEIKQADGQWIVTSPIWYKNTLPQGIKENEPGIKLNFFPNPVNQDLSISVDDCELYTVVITDVMGKEVLKDSFNEKDHTISIRNLEAGTYFLKVNSGNKMVVKKLVVE